MHLSSSRRLFGVLAAAAILVAACGPGATPSPTAAPPSEPPASTAPTEAPSVAPSPVAVVPDAQLVFPGKLVMCSDIPYPPQEFFDDQGNPTGADVDLGAAIADRLGLSLVVENSVFDTIILALQGGKCDIIISAQNITSQRVKQVNMIPYFQAGQAFVVAKGNPKGIQTQDDLCGNSVGAETGTTMVDYLKGTGDYKGQGLSEACTKKGLPAITIKEYQKDSDALLALQSGAVDAYMADSPVAGYYTVQQPDEFELAPPQVGVALEGISVPNDAGHADLSKAVQTALVSLINDGTYLEVLKKYGLESGAVTADVAQQMNLVQ
jgi:polar amino acid transport system substrate-binding protein